MRKNIYICKTCYRNHLAEHKDDVTAPFMSTCYCGEMAQSTFYKLEHMHTNSKADKVFFYETPGDVNSLNSKWNN